MSQNFQMRSGAFGTIRKKHLKTFQNIKTSHPEEIGNYVANLMNLMFYSLVKIFI